MSITNHLHIQVQKLNQAHGQNSSPQHLIPNSSYQNHHDSAYSQAICMYRTSPYAFITTESFQTDHSARIAILLVFLVLVLVVACVKASISYHKRRLYSKLHGCQPPPLENPHDFLGFSKIIRSTKSFLAKESLDSAIKLFQRHGNTYTTRVLTSMVVFTCDPNIRQILATGFSDWESSPLRGHLFEPLLSQSIFQLDGPRWKTTRDIYRNEAHFSNLRILLDLDRQEKSIQNLLDRIPNGQAFDLYTLFRHLMMDLTSGFCFGESTGSLTLDQSQEKKEFAEAITDIQQRIAASGFVGPLSRLMSKKQMRNDSVIIHNFADKYIDDVLAKSVIYDEIESEDIKPRTYNILSSLAEPIRNKVELRDYVTTILIAGTESSSSLLSSVMYLLARNQHVFLRLRQSVLNIVGRDIPTSAQLKNLPYLRCVLNEALRVFPPVPLNARVANTETTLPVGGGPDGTSPIYIHKGQKIVFSSFAVHRSEQIWGEDALVFRPERWENSSALKDGGAFFPFLIGPRACPGQQYVMAEASYTIVRLLQTYKEVIPRDERPWTECMGLNLRNENGCWLELVKDEQAVV